MKGAELIHALKRKFRVTTDAAIAKHLGISIPAMQLWKNRHSVTLRQIASLVHKASYKSSVVRPVVEFFQIDSCSSKQNARLEIFSASDSCGIDHPYRVGLKAELRTYHGVYIFFDSRGRAIYAGKARHQSLWKEINSAFNRERGEIQSLYRVAHPAQRVAYTVKPRQIKNRDVALHELAYYFSAYHVPDPIINDMEAMLVRSFANDLLNIRIERFSG